MENQIPTITGELRSHFLMIPQTVWKASGIIVFGRRIKSLLFSTDIAIIRNCNADAVLAVYPFTPQQVIANAIITASSIPVFCGVGGGITNGARSVILAKDAEALGAFGVVVNVPITNETISTMKRAVDIPVIATVVNRSMDIDARIKAGASILNVSAAAKTPPNWCGTFAGTFPQFPLSAPAGLRRRRFWKPSRRALMPSAIRLPLRKCYFKAL